MSPALRRRIRNHIFSSGVALCGGLGTAALGAMFLFLLAGAFPALRDQGLTQMLLSPCGSLRWGGSDFWRCSAPLLPSPSVLSCWAFRSLCSRRPSRKICCPDGFGQPLSGFWS